jgi:hypothetical protein
MILLLPLLLQAASLDAREGADVTPFHAVSSYSSAEQCRDRLSGIVRDARGYDAVRGPYALAEGDVRIHLVRAEGGGHVVTEHRCIGIDHETRSWRHALGTEDEAVTIEGWAARAPWLQKGAAEQ